MKRRVFIWIVVLSFVLGLGIIAVLAVEKRAKDDFYRQIELFTHAFSTIQAEYVEDIKTKDLIYGALKGMLSSLDAYSQFLDPESYNELKVETEGEFGGLGIEITIKDNLLTVITPIEDTPAWQAGLKAGDRIVKINDKLTRDITLMEAVKHLRGKPGTEVKITIWREGEERLLDFNIVRDIIRINDVKEARILEEGIGYVKLIEFRENTSEEFKQALLKLKEEAMEGLILDLRNNPGGLLETAVEVASLFIPKDNLVVYTKGRRPSGYMEFRSQEKDAYLDLPVVVLVNEGTASGSEIVAACLREYKRAIILGTKSFGKGSVQTIIPLPDGSAVRLTTSKYYTPSGFSIHEQGIIPDLVVETAKVERVSEEKKEEDIFKELEKEDKSLRHKKEYSEDNQLLRAIDLLKGIKVYRQLSLQ